ncbi:MAG: hypothetical protein O9320_14040 [Magnetospirillum sp.]|nr:hypothetical protein [Magnetospirillum sp.]
MKKWATILIGIYLLLAAPAAAIYLGTAVATFVVVGGFACAMLLRADELVEVTIGPLKARLERQVAQATATLEQLRGLAATFGEVILAVLAGEGRMGGMGYKSKMAFKGQVDERLRQLGLSDEQLSQTRKTWRKYLVYDHAVRIWKSLPVAVHEMSPELRGLLGERNLIPATPDEWRAALQRINLARGDAAEALADYEHFLETDNIRRPELWGLDA